ncbi:MAG: ThiF family adenylyltransferase, partial [Fibrobacteria bacterium]
PEVKVVGHPFLDAENAVEIVSQYDFVVDGSDNFGTKFLVNDACVIAGVPFSHAGILRFEGQAMTIMPRKSRCYRCLFREPPPAGSVPSCSEVGILGVVAGTLGTIQATEAVKCILGKGDLLTDRLLIYDALAMRFRESRGARDPECAVCGDHPTITAPVDYGRPGCIEPL